MIRTAQRHFNCSVVIPVRFLRSTILMNALNVLQSSEPFWPCSAILLPGRCSHTAALLTSRRSANFYLNCGIKSSNFSFSWQYLSIFFCFEPFIDVSGSSNVAITASSVSKPLHCGFLPLGTRGGIFPLGTARWTFQCANPSVIWSDTICSNCIVAIGSIGEGAIRGTNGTRPERVDSLGTCDVVFLLMIIDWDGVYN